MAGACFQDIELDIIDEITLRDSPPYFQVSKHVRPAIK